MDRPKGTFCLAGAGFLDDFLRLPIVCRADARRGLWPNQCGTARGGSARAVT